MIEADEIKIHNSLGDIGSKTSALNESQAAVLMALTLRGMRNYARPTKFSDLEELIGFGDEELGEALHELTNDDLVVEEKVPEGEHMSYRIHPSLFTEEE